MDFDLSWTLLTGTVGATKLPSCGRKVSLQNLDHILEKSHPTKSAQLLLQKIDVLNALFPSATQSNTVVFTHGAIWTVA